MLIILPPIAVGINYVLYGFRYFSELRVFFLATLATLGILILIYISCGMVAGIMQYRLPKYSQTFKRIGISLVGGGVPQMGAHWVDVTSPELNGSTFAQTFIYGSYDGQVNFYEPMITLDFLKNA